MPKRIAPYQRQQIKSSLSVSDNTIISQDRADYIQLDDVLGFIEKKCVGFRISPSEDLTQLVRHNLNRLPLYKQNMASSNPMIMKSTEGLVSILSHYDSGMGCYDDYGCFVYAKLEDIAKILPDMPEVKAYKSNHLSNNINDYVSVFNLIMYGANCHKLDNPDYEYCEWNNMAMISESIDELIGLSSDENVAIYTYVSGLKPKCTLLENKDLSSLLEEETPKLDPFKGIPDDFFNFKIYYIEKEVAINTFNYSFDEKMNIDLTEPPLTTEIEIEQLSKYLTKIVHLETELLAFKNKQDDSEKLKAKDDEIERLKKENDELKTNSRADSNNTSLQVKAKELEIENLESLAYGLFSTIKYYKDEILSSQKKPPEGVRKLGTISRNSMGLYLSELLEVQKYNATLKGSAIRGKLSKGEKINKKIISGDHPLPSSDDIENLLNNCKISSGK